VVSVTVTNGGSGYNAANPPQVHLITATTPSVRVGETDLTSVKTQIDEIGVLVDQVVGQVGSLSGSVLIPAGTQKGVVQYKDPVSGLGGSDNLLFDTTTQTLRTSALGVSGNATVSGSLTTGTLNSTSASITSLTKKLR
jgi:hypothetical protein